MCFDHFVFVLRERMFLEIVCKKEMAALFYIFFQIRFPEKCILTCFNNFEL